MTHTITIKGVELKDYAAKEKAGEIVLHALECVTGKNGWYKLTYRDRNKTNQPK